MFTQATPQAADAAYWSATLRGLGRRVTKQRLAVLGAVHHTPHSTAEEVLAAARTQLPDLSVQSVRCRGGRELRRRAGPVPGPV